MKTWSEQWLEDMSNYDKAKYVERSYTSPSPSYSRESMSYYAIMALVDEMRALRLGERS